jgi:hypothetical protein
MKLNALTTTVVAGVLSTMFAVSTLADEFVFFSPIAGSNPGSTIAGVASGGAPWVVRHGTAILTDGGRLRIDVRGLILPSTGNTGPVTQVAASVVCSNTVAATTPAVNLASDGDAEIRAKVVLPSPCLGAAVLIRVAGTNNAPLPAPGAFIAATGLVKDAQDKDAEDHDNNDNNGRGR